MSSTATSSEGQARPPRRSWAPRWLVIAHRYLGVGVGLLMLAWCLSGVVMLFVHYPQVSEDARTARLAPIDWARCCTFGDSLAPTEQVEAAALEDLAGVPVLRATLTGGEHAVIDLSTGRALAPITAAVATQTAARFARAPADGAETTRVLRDQWTVSGEFNRFRPLWRVRLPDRAATEIYVSSVTGEVVQRTTRNARVLNWLGAVPHWLYPTLLRQHVKLWSQVVIWTSVLGLFLTLTGLYLGWWPGGRSATGGCRRSGAL